MSSNTNIAANPKKHCAECNDVINKMNRNIRYCGIDCKKKAKKRRPIASPRMLALKQWVDNIKLSRGCENTECGWVSSFTSVMLDFHHLNPDEKITTIANLINTRSQEEKIAEEIAKCQVLCSNCHREETKLNKHN